MKSHLHHGTQIAVAAGPGQSPPDPEAYGDAAAARPPEPDDATLITGSLRQPDQFAGLFRRHAPEITRYVTRRIGPDAADDVVAETFLAAFRGRDRYQPGQPDARPWLYGIATNLIARHRRSEIRQFRAFARSGVDPVTEPFSDRVDNWVSADAAGRKLAAALTRIPAGQRDALLLVAWGQLTYAEAALALDVEVGTIRSRLNRARTALRIALGGDPLALNDTELDTEPDPPRGGRSATEESTA